jgi:hypothetical protein
MKEQRFDKNLFLALEDCLAGRTPREVQQTEQGGSTTLRRKL